MNDLGIIFQAEFLRKVRSRPFVIGTIIGMIGIVLLTSLPQLLQGVLGKENRKIVLAGDANLTAQAKMLLQPDFVIVAVLPTPVATPTLAMLDAHAKATALVVLARDARGLHATAYARDPANFPASFTRDLVPLSIAVGTRLSTAEIRPLLNVKLDIKSLDAQFANESAAAAAKGIAALLGFVLYLSIIINAQTVMSSVAEEKTNRIAELLVATTSPAMLLAGKVLAAGCAGAIQVAAWGAAGFASAIGLVSLGGSAVARTNDARNSPFSFDPNDVSNAIVAAFLVFFILGFLQYATLFAAAASLITRTEDLGSVSVPLVIPAVAGFMLSQFTLASPNSPNVAIISQIPLLAPFVMFTRMAVSTVPAWQIAVSLMVNAAATVAIIWGAGKVYRVGMLMYGRLPSLRQVLAALRA